MSVRLSDAGPLGWTPTAWVSPALRTATPRKLVNAIRAELAHRRRATDGRAMPYLLVIEPLGYCGSARQNPDASPGGDDRPDGAGRLALATYERVLDELGPYLFQVRLFGRGEPMANWKLTGEIVRQARARRISAAMRTDATLIDADRADRVVRSGLDQVVCTIDGVASDAAIAGLRHLAEARRRHGAPMRIEWRYRERVAGTRDAGAARALARGLGVGFRAVPAEGADGDDADRDGADRDGASASARCAIDRMDPPAARPRLAS